MSKPCWEDITTYCQGEVGDARVPRVWEFRTEHLSVRVHRHRDYLDTDWLLSCHSIGVEKHLLHFQDLGEAQAQALDFVRKRLRLMVKELGPI